MKLILRRNIYSPNAVHGKITWGAVDVCCTVESPAYLLPKGVYKMKLFKRVLYDEESYEIRVFKNQKYANKQQAVICAGNGVYNLQSPTIHIGKYQCRGLVVQGATYMKHLVDDIQTANGDEVLLEIC